MKKPVIKIKKPRKLEMFFIPLDANDEDLFWLADKVIASFRTQNMKKNQSDKAL